MKKPIKEISRNTKRILTYCTISLIFIACRNDSKIADNTNIKQIKMSLIKNEIDEIKQHIEYQKRIVSDEQDSDDPYQPTITDLNLSVKIISEGLKNNGYKMPTTEYFNQRLKEIFNIENLKSIECKTHITENYISVFSQEDQKNYNKILKDEFGNSTMHPILFLMRKDHLITEMQTLNELIEFKKDNTYQINLDPYIIHRNKYLFNNDKASLAWLLNNQLAFLKTLLTDFGYDKESKINKKVLDSSYNIHSPELIGELFFTKNCNNKLEIRKGLLNYVKNNTSATDNRFIYALGSFMYTLYDGDAKDPSYKIFDEDPSKKFTDVEKAEIVANIANIENPAIEKYKSLASSDVWNKAGSSLYNISVSHPEVIKIIEQHNYFGLPKMKEIIAKLQEEAPPTGADPE